jgi:hypothetical protein
MSETFTDKAGNLVANLGATLKALIKIAITPRGSIKRSYATDASKSLIILGNGPSLRTNIDNDADLLAANHTLAVNFAANTPEFFTLRPRFYVLADPHFFLNRTDANVSRLLTALNRVDWAMTLFVPSTVGSLSDIITNSNISVERFPFIAAEGFRSFEHYAFSKALAMPRPRNVLIPSIMIGAWLGYRNIFLLGADHSWLQTLSVTDDNRVVSIQPHFYKEDEGEQRRVIANYMGIKLHEVLESMYIAFKSYHVIADWAMTQGVNIYNSTPGSMIDAFPRKPITAISKL